MQSLYSIKWWWRRLIMATKKRRHTFGFFFCWGIPSRKFFYLLVLNSERACIWHRPLDVWWRSDKWVQVHGCACIEEGIIKGIFLFTVFVVVSPGSLLFMWNPSALLLLSKRSLNCPRYTYTSTWEHIVLRVFFVCFRHLGIFCEFSTQSGR